MAVLFRSRPMPQVLLPPEKLEQQYGYFGKQEGAQQHRECRHARPLIFSHELRLLFPRRLPICPRSLRPVPSLFASKHRADREYVVLLKRMIIRHFHLVSLFSLVLLHRSHHLEFANSLQDNFRLFLKASPYELNSLIQNISPRHVGHCHPSQQFFLNLT